jgi:hypothetical protein
MPSCPIGPSVAYCSTWLGRSFLLSLSSSSRHLDKSHESRSSAYPRSLKEEGTDPLPEGWWFCRPAPAVAAACLCSKLPLASINLTGRFPPSSRRRFTIHPVSSGESSERFASQVRATNGCSSICFCFFRAESQKRRLGPPCRNPPMPT